MADLLGLGVQNPVNGTTTTPNSTGFDWSSLLGNLASNVLDYGIASANASDKAKINNDFATAFAASQVKGRDRLNKGYDEKLANVEQGTDVLNNINKASFDEQQKLVDQGSGDYDAAIAALARQYGMDLNPAYDTNAAQTRGALADYQGNLQDIESRLAGVIGQANDAYAEHYDPYVESGDRALEYTQSILGSDPSQLTLSQQRAYDEGLRQMKANLAASHLRGAGRAGVASINDGIADMQAKFADENQQRQDRAAQSLLTTGYNATGQEANNQSQNFNELQGYIDKYGSAGADAGFKTANTLNDRNLTLDQKIADLANANREKVATNNLNTAKTKAGLVATMNSNLAANEAPRYETRANTALNKAINDTTAQQSSDYLANTTTAQNAIGKSDALNSLYSALNDSLKKSAFPQSGTGSQNQNIGKKVTA